VARYRTPHPTLNDLVAELQAVVIGDACLSGADLAQAHVWLSLPRYQRDRGEPTARLAADIRDAVETFEPRAREHLRILLRLESTPPEKKLSDRRDRALKKYSTQYGGSAKTLMHEQVLARLAFGLYQQALEIPEPDHELDFGFRSIRHDWSVHLESADGRTAVYTSRSWARAIRHGQRFYIFGGDLDGGLLVDEPWIPQDRTDAGHRYVGTVRVDAAHTDVVFHVVYLGAAFQLDDEVEVAVCRRVHARADHPFGLFFESRGPEIRAVDLSVTSADTALIELKVVERFEKGVLPESRPYPFDAPSEPALGASVHIAPVHEGHEYELIWRLAH
jgi:hypothetical protein